MSEHTLKVLCVIGTSSKSSETHVVVSELAQILSGLGAEVDVFNPAREPLQLFNPESAYTLPEFQELKRRVDQADVYVLGTPDYHGSVSSTLKNFLDHFWKEFAGKLFVPLVGSHEKGLTVIDQLRTISRQCYAWSLPYGISVASQVDVKEGKIATDGIRKRLEMAAHDIAAYGAVLRRQRQTDLAGDAPGFLAHHRAPKGK